MLRFQATKVNLIIMIIVALAAICFGFTFNLEDSTIETKGLFWRNNESGFTYAEVERLKPGMYLYEVEAIFGRATKSSQSMTSVSYKWQAANGGWLICQFDNQGKLLSFQQEGLR